MDNKRPESEGGKPQGGYQPEKGDLDKTNPPKQGSGVPEIPVIPNHIVSQNKEAVLILEDPWKHRSEGMKCKTCMWFVNFRCRRHAPTMNGYPAVFPNDWCGDHKLDKKDMGGE